MSHPTITSKSPWKSLFAEHLEKLGGGGAEFVLATVTSTGLPKARYCIFRGFWGSLPENPHNKLTKNPAIYESDCPTFATDCRMSKTFDFFATGKGKGDLEQSRSGTGGGGPVEAVFWVKEVMTQWRIRGKCWVIAADDVEGGEDAAQNSGTVSMKAELQRYVRTVGDDSSQEKDWSWRREVENHFENLSPTMRGSFKNPEPGKPISEGKGNAGEALGQKAGHLSEEELARRNFRVAVIIPEEVEQVDLSDPDNCKRRIWRVAENAGVPNTEGENSQSVKEWNVVETWP